MASCVNNAIDDNMLSEIKALDTVEKQSTYLSTIHNLDQDIRVKLNEQEGLYGYKSKEVKNAYKEMRTIDSENLIKIEKYLEIHGYPKKGIHSSDAVQAPKLVYHHHGNQKIRLRGFRHLYKAFLNGDVSDDGLAFYLNRSYYDKFNGKRISWKGPYRTEDELDTLFKALELLPIIEEIKTERNKQLSMQSLGLLGGTSWHSTIDYYKSISQQVNDFYGDNTNSPLLIYTMNQSKIHKHQVNNEWDSIAEMFIEAAEKLEKAGAQKLMFCANTPHKVYDKVQDRIKTPILHIADATATAIKQKEINKVLFLGTKYTMSEPFVTGRIESNGIEVLSPSDTDQVKELHRIIIEELTYGDIKEESKKYVLGVIRSFQEKGAKGVILGCTEFPLMIHQEDLEIPIFNTTEIHASAGVDFILQKDKNNE